jgi:hypothetical protein
MAMYHFEKRLPPTRVRTGVIGATADVKYPSKDCNYSAKLARDNGGMRTRPDLILNTVAGPGFFCDQWIEYSVGQA